MSCNCYRLLLAAATALIAPKLQAQPAVGQDPETPAAAARKAVEKQFLDDGFPGAVVGMVSGDKILFRVALGYRDVAGNAAMAKDTLFQIGSVTKSMTATLLAILAECEQLSFDDPVGRFFPERAKLPEPIAACTLRELASHTAGMPRVAVNRRNLPDTPSVPAPYSVAQLYAGLARTELIHAPGAAMKYSNLGYGMLGHVVERAANQSYEGYLKKALCEPLGMKDTCITPSAAQEARLATHYWVRDEERIGRDRWHIGEVCGHGGVTSSFDDLVRYVRMQWRTDAGSPLSAAACAQLREPVHADKRGGGMATGWMVYSIAGGPLVGHDGEVDGHSASIAFLPHRKIGVIALVNTGRDAAGRLAKACLRAYQRALARPFSSSK